ncbi:MAG TPA: ribonuclease R, partial [Thermodesulfobacteriaceae bacterium]|nr:ribonuclease R [Thermodesulfobacteriaceae bacterium]
MSTNNRTTTKNRKQTGGRKRRGKKVCLSPEYILKIMTREGRPLYLREILELTGRGSRHRKTVQAMVAELVREGRLVLLKGNRYGVSTLMKVVYGRLVIHPEGYGFVESGVGRENDVFVPARKLKGAIHGDRVVARVEKTGRKGAEGSVLRVLERRISRVVGILHRGKRVCRVVPEDERLLFEVLIPRKSTMKARNGQVVVAEIDDFPAGSRNPEGHITEVVGDPENLEVQTRIVILKHELPHVFSPETDALIRDLPAGIVPEDLKGRRDIRNLPLVTIDGEHARDFDDAVSVKKTRSGFSLTVAIADVSHYVAQGSPLDEDALERSTSVYFPNAVVPMLPEELSNHLCSLVQGEDRLAMVARMTFDLSGRMKKSTFFKAVMNSHARLTYKQVRQILVDGDRELSEKFREFLPQLRCMKELAEILAHRRRKRGSIDFDLPEPEVILGIRGNLEEIVRRERSVAHLIIEEFMIAANEAVAAFFSRKGIPAMYRVHDAPEEDKIREFVDFAGRNLGLDIDVPEQVDPKWCQMVLRKAAGTPQEYIVNSVLLRTMKQAVYSPHNTRHFGLASTDYLHFTSPIRRYPDLIVHRILKANMRRKRKRPVYPVDRLGLMGEHCSTRERAAMQAEWEMLDRLKVRYMAQHLGEVYQGIISTVTSFGFFVELKDMFIHGV